MDADNEMVEVVWLIF